MSSPSPVLLVLGAGRGVGLSTAAHFAEKGYRVAIVSRKVQAREFPKYLTINADFSDPQSIQAVFNRVRDVLGDPNVVLYNAVSWPRPMAHTFDVAPGAFTTSVNVNYISPVFALQQTIAGFIRLPQSIQKVFLFTGNCLNEKVIPRYWAMGAGKSATAHALQAASSAYKDCGWRFHYLDERNEEDLPVYDDIDGDAHAKIGWELVQKPVSQTLIVFTKDKGIVNSS